MAEVDMKDAPEWKKGIFQILFFSMGQGDCCVITCPDGKHIMVDCGSKATEAWDLMININETLRSTSVLQLANSDQNRIDSLILTHPDKDHINKVKEILGGTTYSSITSTGTTKFVYPRIPVGRVFFSDFNRDREDFKQGPLRMYGFGCNDAIYDTLGVNELYCVTLTSTLKLIDRWTRPFTAAVYQSFDLSGLGTNTDSSLGIHLSSDRVTIAKATDNSWSVSIIAGNVIRDFVDQSDNDGRNAASLVTLIKIGNEKILICGDATSSTEGYLTKQFPIELKGITLLQAPHHGSSTTSSTPAFIDLVQPRMVAISVQMNEHSHHLPGQEPLTLYLKYAQKTETAHATNYWSRIRDTDFETAKNDWINKKTSNQLDFEIQQDDQFRDARLVLKNIDKTYSGIKILDGLNSSTSKYALNQTPISQDIKQTGIDQHLWYYFDGKG